MSLGSFLKLLGSFGSLLFPEFPEFPEFPLDEPPELLPPLFEPEPELEEEESPELFAVLVDDFLLLFLETVTPVATPMTMSAMTPAIEPIICRKEGCSG